MARTVQIAAQRGDTGSAWEVLRIFLKLGCTCFGGPIAHLGYFRDEFVTRRRWLEEHAYAELVALCQFLPGPASSQVGFSIGLMRAGLRGGLAAWLGFTLPSAVAMMVFAQVVLRGSVLHDSPLLHGLKLVAVAIVAQAVLGMSRTLCPDRPRAAIAVVTALLVLLAGSSSAQLMAIAIGAAAGWWLCRTPGPGAAAAGPAPVSRRVGLLALGLFFGLLAAIPLLSSLGQGSPLALFDAFYRCGALVFGGGHVVLPLLRQAFVEPGWVDDGTFLAGYGAAQALPGPLFTFAAYLGAVVKPAQYGVPGALLGLTAIFLPGMLILLGALPFWQTVRQRLSAQAMMRGVNAAVVGLLVAALYHPLWTSSVKTAGDFGIVLAGFVLLTRWAAPPIAVVGLTAAAAIAQAAFTR